MESKSLTWEEVQEQLEYYEEQKAAGLLAKQLEADLGQWLENLNHDIEQQWDNSSILKTFFPTQEKAIHCEFDPHQLSINLWLERIDLDVDAVLQYMVKTYAPKYDFLQHLIEPLFSDGMYIDIHSDEGEYFSHAHHYDTWLGGLFPPRLFRKHMSGEKYYDSLNPRLHEWFICFGYYHENLLEGLDQALTGTFCTDDNLTQLSIFNIEGLDQALTPEQDQIVRQAFIDWVNQVHEAQKECLDHFFELLEAELKQIEDNLKLGLAEYEDIEKYLAAQIEQGIQYSFSVNVEDNTIEGIESVQLNVELPV